MVAGSLSCVAGGHTSPVSCVAISAEDELIASGGDEGKAVLYSRRTEAGRAGYLVGREQDNVLLRQDREDEERDAEAAEGDMPAWQ